MRFGKCSALGSPDAYPQHPGLVLLGTAQALKLSRSHAFLCAATDSRSAGRPPNFGANRQLCDAMKNAGLSLGSCRSAIELRPRAVRRCDTSAYNINPYAPRGKAGIRTLREI